jgi:hypothetical protein
MTRTTVTIQAEFHKPGEAAAQAALAAGAAHQEAPGSNVHPIIAKPSWWWVKIKDLGTTDLSL